MSNGSGQRTVEGGAPNLDKHSSEMVNGFSWGPPTSPRSYKNCYRGWARRREATSTLRWSWLPRAVFLSSRSSTFTSWLAGGASSSLSIRALTKSSWFPGNTPKWSPGRYWSSWCPLVWRRRKIVKRLQGKEKKQDVFWGDLQGVAELWPQEPLGVLGSGGISKPWCPAEHVIKVAAGS